MSVLDEFANKQGFDAGSQNVQAQQYNPTMMNQYQQRPQMTNPLTPEEFKILLTQEDCFNLKVSREEIAKAICTHKHPDKGTFAIVPGNNPAGDVTCTICHTTFYPDLVDETYVQQATDAMLNVLQTLKYIGVDLSNDVIRQYFSMIPYIERVPKLYKAVDNTFKKYHMVNPTMQQSGPNVYSMYNMLVNPAATMASPVGAYPYMAPQQNMQNNMVAGGNPFYGYQQPQQPMYGYPQQPVQQMPPQQVAPSPMPPQGQPNGYYNPYFGAPTAPVAPAQVPQTPTQQPAQAAPVAPTQVPPVPAQQPITQDVQVNQPVQL